jgi:hypothetical protein
MFRAMSALVITAADGSNEILRTGADTRATPVGFPECSGQRIPTGANVAQSVQIGRPHSEQESPVSRSGCR